MAGLRRGTLPSEGHSRPGPPWHSRRAASVLTGETRSTNRSQYWAMRYCPKTVCGILEGNDPFGAQAPGCLEALFRASHVSDDWAYDKFAGHFCHDSTREVTTGLCTDWFFDNSYGRHRRTIAFKHSTTSWRDKPSVETSKASVAVSIRPTVSCLSLWSLAF